jgi:hypothetical protein
MPLTIQEMISGEELLLCKSFCKFDGAAAVRQRQREIEVDYVPAVANIMQVCLACAAL